MKKSFLFLAAIFMMHNYTQAQFNVGVRTGVGSANIRATEGLALLPIDYSRITGWNVGLVSEIEFGKHFAIQPELSYHSKGFRVREQGDFNILGFPVPVGASAITRVGYVEAPILLKGKIGNEYVNAYLIAGPSLGYAAHGRFITRAKAFFEFTLLDTSIDLNQIGYERFEVAGIAGAGVEFKLPAGKIFMDARYQHGFTRLYDVPLANETWRNYNVGVNVGYMMSF